MKLRIATALIFGILLGVLGTVGFLHLPEGYSYVASSIEKLSNPKPLSEKPLNKEPFIVGALLPQTGPGGVFAEYIRKGIELSVSEINSIDKDTINVVYADSKNDPKEGVAAFQQLILSKKPPVVISALSSVTKAVAPLAKENNTVLIGTAVGMPGITDASDFVFRVYPEAHGLAGVIAEHAISKFKSAAIIYIDDDFGLSGAKVFKQVFEAKGGKVLLMEPYRIAESDFRTQLLRIKKAKPNCVWITGYGPGYTVIVRQMREAEFTSAILGDMTLGLPVTIQNLGVAAEGIVYVDGTMSQGFIDKYKATYKEAPSSYAGYAYDSIGMVNMLRSKGLNSPQILRDGLSSIKIYPGAMGDISMKDNRDAALVFTVMQIKNGIPTPFK